MSIQFSCSCGKRLQVAENMVGKSVRCPQCSQVIMVAAGDAVESAHAVPAPPLPEHEPATIHSWLYPPKSNNFILVLADDALWRYSEVLTSVAAKQEALETANDIGEVLGKDALRIPLADIQKIETDKRRANLVVRYRTKDKNGNWINRSTESFIDDPAKRDENV